MVLQALAKAMAGLRRFIDQEVVNLGKAKPQRLKTELAKKDLTEMSEEQLWEMLESGELDDLIDAAIDRFLAKYPDGKTVTGSFEVDLAGGNAVGDIENFIDKIVENFMTKVEGEITVNGTSDYPSLSGTIPAEGNVYAPKNSYSSALQKFSNVLKDKVHDRLAEKTGLVTLPSEESNLAIVEKSDDKAKLKTVGNGSGNAQDSQNLLVLTYTTFGVLFGIAALSWGAYFLCRKEDERDDKGFSGAGSDFTPTKTPPKPSGVSVCGACCGCGVPEEVKLCEKPERTSGGLDSNGQMPNGKVPTHTAPTHVMLREANRPENKCEPSKPPSPEDADFLADLLDPKKGGCDAGKGSCDPRAL